MKYLAASLLLAARLAQGLLVAPQIVPSHPVASSVSLHVRPSAYRTSTLGSASATKLSSAAAISAEGAYEVGSGGEGLNVKYGPGECMMTQLYEMKMTYAAVRT